VNEELVQQIRYSQFRTTGLRAGYDVNEIDAFLDRLITDLERDHDVSGLVEAARFSPVKRRGYEMTQVDDLLDRIAGRPTGRALKNTLDAPEARDTRAEDPPEVVQEQVGFLGKLFGRPR
jgi:DivIVA domain-containing protein